MQERPCKRRARGDGTSRCSPGEGQRKPRDALAVSEMEPTSSAHALAGRDSPRARPSVAGIPVHDSYREAGLQVHESHVLRSRGGYVWCQQCGAYYSKLPLSGSGGAKLKRECQVATQVGRANLKRIRGGLLPDRLASKLAKRLSTSKRRTRISRPQTEIF